VIRTIWLDAYRQAVSRMRDELGSGRFTERRQARQTML